MSRPLHCTVFALCALACSVPLRSVASAEVPTSASAVVVTATSATDAYAEFRRAFDAEQYVEAVPWAQRVLTLAEQQAQDPAAEDVQVALMNLGLTQYLATDYVAAEASFRRAIRLIEDSGRPLHQRLARAHAWLARTYHDGARHDLAVVNFEQAIALTRRHQGLLTQEQVPLVEKYIDSLTELGQYQVALKAQRYLLRIATRKHGADSVELVPTLERIGSWYARVGAYDQARQTLQHAVEIIEAAEGLQSPKLIGPLVAIAACDRKQLRDPTQQAVVVTPDTRRSTVFQPPGEPEAGTYSATVLIVQAEKSLLRAAMIAEQRPDRSLAQIADVRTQLGDWYQARGQTERALPHYLDAWQAAAGAGASIDGKPLIDALFGRPVMLQITRPYAWDRYASRPREQIEIHTVSIDHSVDPQGRPQAGRILDDSGDAARAGKTLEALGSARYRPRFEQGQPVATTGVVYSQPWIVLVEQPKDVAKPATEVPAAPAAEAGSAAPNGGAAPH